ncbi:hypothetical protein LTR62_008530 [Meristemomyces frigidus]|uniref:Coenzyme Q-binding protein COQ10 START domain-containing protein n=1 Tax=Meristemomyces frigidus TaxID=1508187 RepID=A0AAN7YIV0_9PEZI|nr:hypothetical protein LTR62_008530 [Meristemomyces frigidus]
MAPTSTSLNTNEFRDASSSAFRPTHSIPKGGLFSIYADIAIDAPVQAVCDVILDVLHWKDWNDFYGDVDITGHPHPHSKNLKMMEGTNMDFNIHTASEETSKLHMTCSHIGRVRTLEDHDPPALTHIRWTYHNAGHMQPGFILRAERENEMEDLGNGKTMYRTWQSFSGLAAKGYRKKFEESLKGRFQEWCSDLKKQVETLHSRGQVGVPSVLVQQPSKDSSVA